MLRAVRTVKAFYDIIGGDSRISTDSDKFTITATFPKDSSQGELTFNRDKIPIEYNEGFVDYFLHRTRLHKYMDYPLLRSFFGNNISLYLYVKSKIQRVRTT